MQFQIVMEQILQGVIRTNIYVDFSMSLEGLIAYPVHDYVKILRQ